jgi:hypothetical protein
MEYLLNVGAALHLPKEGYVVIGNNPEHTIDDITKINVKGKTIMIQTSAGDHVFEVTDVRVSFSIIGKPNIGLTLKESENFNKIKPGDLIFKCNE